MAAIGRVFAAQKTRPCQGLLRNVLLDPSLPEEFPEPSLIFAPRAALFPVGLEHLLCGGQQRQVDVVDAAERPDEVPKVVLLGEARQLRNIVPSDVDESRNPGVLQTGKELLGRFLCKPDGEDLHGRIEPAAIAVGLEACEPVREALAGRQPRSQCTAAASRSLPDAGAKTGSLPPAAPLRYRVGMKLEKKLLLLL